MVHVIRLASCLFFVVSVCLPPDLLSQCLPSYLGFSGRFYRPALGFTSSWASLVAQMVKVIFLKCRRPEFYHGLGRSPGGEHGNPLQLGISPVVQWLRTHLWASLMGQTVKSLPAMEETWVPSLDWEAPLDSEETSTHSGILAWKIPWIFLEPGWVTVHGVAKSQAQLCWA